MGRQHVPTGRPPYVVRREGEGKKLRKLHCCSRSCAPCGKVAEERTACRRVAGSGSKGFDSEQNVTCGVHRKQARGAELASTRSTKRSLPVTVKFSNFARGAPVFFVS